jgi:hypothetical protein
VERWTVESLSPTIHKKPLFPRVKPRDPRDLRVPPKGKPDKNNYLILVTPSLLRLPLLLGASGGETILKILAPPRLLNRLPKNLLLKKRVLSTPTIKMAPLAHKLLYLCIFPFSVFFRIFIFLY